MTATGVLTCGVCGSIHGAALGQCPMYLATIEAEARGRAAGEAMVKAEQFVSAYRRLRARFGPSAPVGAFDELDALCGLFEYTAAALRPPSTGPARERRQDAK